MAAPPHRPPCRHDPRRLYRAEDLAYLVELADTGHYQPVTQTTVDLDDIAAAHRLADTGPKRGNVVVRIPHTHPEGHRS